MYWSMKSIVYCMKSVIVGQSWTELGLFCCAKRQLTRGRDRLSAVVLPGELGWPVLDVRGELDERSDVYGEADYNAGLPRLDPRRDVGPGFERDAAGRRGGQGGAAGRGGAARGVMFFHALM